MATPLPPHEIPDLTVGLSEKATPRQRARADAILNRLGYFFFGGDSRLSGNQWRILQEGFAKGAGKDEKAQLEAALETLGFVPKLSAKKKPGRQKKETTNLSDKELLRLISTLRVRMGVAPDKPNLAIKQIVLIVLQNANELLRTYLFFTADDSARIRSLRDRAGKCPIEIIQEFLPHLDGLIGCFNTTESLVSPQLTDLIFDAGLRLQDEAEGKVSPYPRSPISKDEDEINVEIAMALGLDGPAWLQRMEADQEEKSQPENLATTSTEIISRVKSEDVSESSPHAKGSAADAAVADERQRKVKPLSMKELGIWRADILRTALGRLTHLHQLFVDTDQGLHMDDISSVYRFLQEDMYWRDLDSDATPILEDLWSVFLGALDRQGVNPFPGEKLEDLIITPGPVADGEISTGGYLDGRRSARSKTRRRSFTKIKSTQPD